jgi:hypothetical protein
VPREGGFEITVASEVMAILCLARDLQDFKARVERVIVGETATGALVEARQLKAAGAMAVLMKDAVKPNLVQTLEGTPAFVHGGPFGNIAHGCNSLIATRLALKLGEIVVTEAGFASDLGAEKFVDIKARTGGLTPSAAVIVATVRALKLHGGVALADLGREDEAAVRRGTENLAKHVENVRSFGLTPVVALNHFTGDTESEVAAVLDICRGWGVRAAISRGWELGGAGTTELAEALVEVMGSADRGAFHQLYPDEWSLTRKIETIVTRLYGGDGVQVMPAAAAKLARWEALGYGKLPVCMAKTQNSLSDDAKKLGRPRGFTVTVRDAKLAAPVAALAAGDERRRRARDLRIATAHHRLEARPIEELVDLLGGEGEGGVVVVAPEGVELLHDDAAGRLRVGVGLLGRRFGRGAEEHEGCEEQQPERAHHAATLPFPGPLIVSRRHAHDPARHRLATTQSQAPRTGHARRHGRQRALPRRRRLRCRRPARPGRRAPLRLAAGVHHAPPLRSCHRPRPPDHHALDRRPERAAGRLWPGRHAAPDGPAAGVDALGHRRAASAHARAAAARGARDGGRGGPRARA